MFNLSQLVQKPTRNTENSQTLIDVIMTRNNSIVSLCGTLRCSISDHDLVYLVLTFRTPGAKPSFITTKSFKGYIPDDFRTDLSFVPFHMIFFFDDFNDQVDTFNTLFQQTLDLHAPIKRNKIKSKPNPFVSAEIRQLMKTRDKWYKRAKKTNDKLHWNTYSFFRQEVRHEL